MLKFTPREIQKQDFKKVIRGYDPVEVDMFLEIVSDEFELLLRQKKDLDEKIVKYETELKNYKQVGGSLQETLLEAKRTTAESLETSKREARMILQEAEIKAREITEDARRELQKLREEITILKTQRDSFIHRWKEWVKVLELYEEENAALGEIQRRRRKGSLPEDVAAKQTVQDESVKESPLTKEPSPKGEFLDTREKLDEKSEGNGQPPQYITGADAPQQDALQQDTKQDTLSPQETKTTPPPEPESPEQQKTEEHEPENVQTSRIQNGFNLIDKIIDEEEEKSSKKPDGEQESEQET